MKVKRLEIQGFKSFKDKTVLHFDEGVTGIVGPNGCGKSNIVDAFFWVMGEQSIKHMRADGQLDLIFNGSEKYSPLSMAEVTMVLATGANLDENEDISARDLPAHLKYEEISITRRLYRDGESEYFINGQQCRLKDIHELFMDTGAGPKAYSIIEQGQIAKIIQSKPEDRRVLVEEAAGIVKFKARKKESLRKIEATQANLARINDIIAEIERQLASLERQAHKARQYKNWKEELLHKEMLVGRKKLFGLKNFVSDATGKVQTLEFNEIESRNSLQTAELRIENFKIQMAEAQRIVEDGQAELQSLQIRISQEDTKLQLHKRQIVEIENSNLTLEEEQIELIASIERLTTERDQLAAELDSLEKMFASAEETLQSHQSKLNEAKEKSEQLGAVVEQEKRELLSSVSRKNEISNQVHGLEARVDALSVQLSGISRKMTEDESEVEFLSQKLTSTKSAYEQVNAESKNCTAQFETVKSEVQNLEIELKQIRSDEAQAREDKAKVESKHKALEQLIQNHDGLKPDVRKILNSEYALNLKGILVDSIQTQPGYEFAVESILKDFLENFLVENATDAISVMNNLKESNQGRATFWAIDLLKQSSLSDFHAFNIQDVTAVIPNAIAVNQVATIAGENAEFISKLFSRYFVVENLDQALMAFQNVKGASFVTKDGEVIDRMGRITGGSLKALEGGLLARKSEFQKLTDELVILTQRFEECQIKHAQIESDLTTKRTQYDELLMRSRELELSAKSAEKDFVSSQSLYDSTKEELDRLREEFTSLDSERKNHWITLDEIRHELASIEESSRVREAMIEDKNKVYLDAVAEASQIQAQMIQFKVDFSAAQEKVKHSRQDHERVSNQLSQDSERREDVERMINHKLDEKDIVHAELAQIEDGIKQLTVQAQTLEESVSERKNNLEITKHEMDVAFNDQRTCMKTLEETSSELSKLKLDLERSHLEYQMLYQSMFQRYGLEESQIAPANEEDQRAFDELNPERETELQQEVDKLHEKIRKLGEVNVMAVEEYDQQKTRYDFLVSQREDLNRSIVDLEKAIERINKTSEERFKIAFEEINKRFERIYPIVFGGGWGKLVMTNPDDMNETGVDIIAEPPGKKVGSIQLMSGGEKALTAVALIFSIFLIKPSPFCVLDEVDAPLDDHNVGKFNALLKEMAARSQFIIITHNKRTMELNDKLYGVTMEEPGVSKMVSIQLQ